MKKILILSLMAAVAVVSCGRGGTNATDASPENEVRTAVEKIYGYVFDVYNSSCNALYDSVQAFDKRYLSAEFLRLSAAVDRVDSLYYPGEIGFRNYDHWVMGQDWDRVSFAVDSVEMLTDNRALAHLTLSNFGTEGYPVDLLVLLESDEWRIGDFIGFFPEPGSELESMKAYVDDDHENTTDRPQP